MTLQVGSWVRWTDASPTRLGYAASDIGKVVGVYCCEGKGLQVDVEFDNGDTVRGAFEPWFEAVQHPQTEDEPADGVGEALSAPPASMVTATSAGFAV